MAAYILKVDGMECVGCEYIIQSELTPLAGIGGADADADAGEVRVFGDPATKPVAQQAIVEAGYDLSDAS